MRRVSLTVVLVALVTRQGCHLCEEALAALRELGVEPDLVDVDSSAAMFDLYDFRVPVVLRDGEPVCEGRISAERLRSLLGVA